MFAFVLVSAIAIVGVRGNFCGTAKKNLTCLASPKDFKIPINSPCSLPQCDQGAFQAQYKYIENQ